MILTPRFANLLAPVARPSRLYLSVMPLRAKIDSRQVSIAYAMSVPSEGNPSLTLLF